MTYPILRGLARLAARVYLAGGLLEIEGLENVPASGGLLVCPNHISTVDPPLVPAFLPRSDSWSMAKSEYFAKGGPKRWLFERYHAFPVVRHTADRRALKRAFDVLRAGHVLLVYPEGTRIEAGGLRRAEPGAGFIAQQTGVPVLPVAMIGTRDCWPKGAWFPRRARVRIVHGRPFRLRARTPEGSRVPAQAAADAIMVAIAEMLPEELRGEYADLGSWSERLGGLRVYEAGSAGG